MKLLILSFYYQPDLCAGSFRTTALVKALSQVLNDGDQLEIITTMPNRYHSFSAEAQQEESDGIVRVKRIHLPPHKSGMKDQARAFLKYALEVQSLTKGRHYDLVFATSSRLLTASLGAAISKKINAPLILDIRDLFHDTLSSLLNFPLKALLPAIRLIEKITFRSAAHMNIVSGGFREDMAIIAPSVPLSFFTNGIDREFLVQNFDKPYQKGSKIKICYAGNIGQGQGLEDIVPGLANTMGNHYEFHIIGDGGTRSHLENKISALSLKNKVILHHPVNRSELIEHYRKSDILFLHLNDCDAFKKVLPSKIFEYAATGKPILAGVLGESRRFLEKNVLGAYCFDPCNVSKGKEALESIPLTSVDRSGFISQFSRDEIMKKMAKMIIQIGKNCP